jgi:hypothetical protein
LPRSLDFLVIYRNRFIEPFSKYNEMIGDGVADFDELINLTNEYHDYQTVETLGREMVNPRSHLSAGTGRPGRLGYGFPVGPNAKLLDFLGITKSKGKEGFNEARARIRTKMNPNPLANVNSSLFEGGKRHRKTKRSKKTNRRTRRK